MPFLVCFVSNYDHLVCLMKTFCLLFCDLCLCVIEEKSLEIVTSQFVNGQGFLQGVKSVQVAFKKRWCGPNTVRKVRIDRKSLYMGKLP